MDFLDLVLRNEKKGKWIHSSFHWDEKNESYTYSAFDQETKKKILYTEEQWTIKGEKNKMSRTNPKIEDLIFSELQTRLDTDNLKSIHEDEIKNINIAGYVQGGKSRVIMLLAWWMMYKKNLDPLLLVANMVNSYNQILIRDIPQFNLWLHENGEDQRRLTIHGLRHVSKGQSVKNKITLCMGNPSQMRKIIKNDSFCVIADESDTFVKHANPDLDFSKTGNLWEEIKTRSKKNFFITATPFANLNQKNIQSCSMRMIVNPQYRGINSTAITKHVLDPEQVKLLTKQDDGLISLIESAILTCNVKDKMKYSSILVNARSTIEKQKKLAIGLQKKGIPSYVINSENSKPITYYKVDGNVEITDMTTIQNLYDFFERDPGEYQCHILISNRMANRAISFRPSFPKTGGLIGEILIPSPSSHCAYKIQCLRICGNYHDSYPQQHLWICKDDLDDIDCEYNNIYKVWIPSNHEYGESRIQMENKEIFYTGKHDRTKVDDTRCMNKYNYCDKRYATKEALLDEIKDQYAHYIFMTENNVISFSAIPNLSKETAHSPSKQNEIREYLKNQLRLHHQINVGNDGFNIAWDPMGSRWKQLNNMETRFFGPNIRYCSKFVGSVNEDYTAINLVIWKKGFFEDDRVDSRTIGKDQFEKEKTAFIYQTTEKEWKFFNRFESKKIGILNHA